MPKHGYTKYSSDVDPWENINYYDNLPYDVPDVDNDDSSDTDSVCSDESDGDRNEKPAARLGRFKGTPGKWDNSK